MDMDMDPRLADQGGRGGILLQFHRIGASVGPGAEKCGYFTIFYSFQEWTSVLRKMESTNVSTLLHLHSPNDVDGNLFFTTSKTQMSEIENQNFGETF